MKKLSLTLATTLFAAAFVITSLAAAAPKAPGLVIRHQTHGCHTWSLNGGAFKASQTLSLTRNASLTITNNDVMPHKLVETSGPAVTITRLSSGMGMGMKGTFPPAMMAHMGSRTKVTFSKPGVYKFTTKVGEDYMSGVKTVGEDNVLRLTVTVS
jgi:hypothetical protein